MSDALIFDTVTNSGMLVLEQSSLRFSCKGNSSMLKKGSAFSVVRDPANVRYLVSYSVFTNSISIVRKF